MNFGKKREEIIIEGSAIIEGGIEIYGERIVGSTNLIIRGIVNSQIEVDADLVLEDEGQVNGDIYVHNCVIKGRVNGNIIASGHLHITDDGSVLGDISCTTLEINNGGHLVGSCNKQSQPVKYVDNFEAIDTLPDEEPDFRETLLKAIS